jgi:hypothetical protein
LADAEVRREAPPIYSLGGAGGGRYWPEIDSDKPALWALGIIS